MPKVFIKNSPRNEILWVEYWEPTLIYNGVVYPVSDSVAKAICKEDYVIYRKPEKRKKKK